MPVIKLKQALHHQQDENAFIVLLKDKGGLRDIPAFCQQQKLHCELLAQAPVIEFLVCRKKESLCR
ncbi:hypothetical protein THMIRHAS_18730 [Thiosulfatimonas sediminis]|uniref:Uncharacterized protein n=2 Tax=Thiosulfatimonas sediminis TaxID=2675054 RepID=A0A6F8PX06_9GAMM|nr:hypothetical protein THMIRHAS_18730 [Thiosulfatimonas sediminis]